MSRIRRIGVLGAGAWGTTLAVVAQRAGRDVVLWARRSLQAATLFARRERLAGALATRELRPYASDDVTGVALGGAVKNVLAIGCGIVVGRGLGENARAALLTRGLAELARLVAAAGGRRETAMGLPGAGD